VTEHGPLHIAIDRRAQRTVLATVQGHRVIDTRRVEHGPEAAENQLAAGLAVLMARAPGPVVGLAGVWRHHAENPMLADLQELVAALGARTSLPTWCLPHGAALALGEWLRAPADGPLAVLAQDVSVAGGVVLDAKLCAPAHLDLGHLSVDANGLKCACGARGCLHGYASETALQEMASDFDVTLEVPSAIDWQVLMASELALRQVELARFASVLGHRAGRAIGIAAARLADTFGVVEVRVRTRHPDLWRVLAPTAIATASQVAGARAPRLVAAHPSEDAFFVGAVAGRP
jgi:predicted NBD/HSP70 family sugar kinase